MSASAGLSPAATRDTQDLAKVLRVIADPVRLQLIALLADAPDQEACVCDLVEGTGLTQPTISHHLKKIHEVGLLDRERRGVWVYYRLRDGAMDAVARQFSALGRPGA